MKQYLSFSLFCSKPYWHLLLSECVKRLLAQPELQGMGYYVRCNFSGGENIRLTISCPAGLATSVTAAIDAYCRHYFEHCHFETKVPMLPVAGVFMPFPDNSIQYGLYYIKHETAVERNTSLVISDIMLNFLSNEAINEERTLTLSIYLAIALLQVTGIAFAALEQEYTVVLKDAFTGDLDQQMLEDSYLHLRLTLGEIYDEVLALKETSCKEVGHWLLSWTEFCRWQQGDGYEPVMILNTAFNHLGMNLNNRALVWYCSINLLKERIVPVI